MTGKHAALNRFFLFLIGLALAAIGAAVAYLGFAPAAEKTWRSVAGDSVDTIAGAAQATAIPGTQTHWVAAAAVLLGVIVAALFISGWLRNVSVFVAPPLAPTAPTVWARSSSTIGPSSRSSKLASPTSPASSHPLCVACRQAARAPACVFASRRVEVPHRPASPMRPTPPSRKPKPSSVRRFPC
jgi:hypothetical protein